MKKACQSFTLFFLAFQFILFQVKVAAAFTRICPLNSAPVLLEYDEVTGNFFVKESSSSEKKGVGDEEEVRQLKRAADRTVRVAGSQHKRHLRARRDEEKRVYMARFCPCSGGVEETYCLVEGTSGPVHDTCGVTHSALTISHSAPNTKVECFKLESHTVFIRNAWPVVVFWYLALLVFLLTTENGKIVRQYVISKVCPSCRINERRLDRIMQREMEHRERILSAATRSARLAEGRGRYLRRTRGLRVPNYVQAPAGGDEAIRRWITQAENLGIETTPTEFVLQTRKFNAKQELMRREQARLLKANSNDDCLGDKNEEGDDVSLHLSTPKKNGIKQDIAVTPETIASCDDDAEEEAESEDEEAVPSKNSLKITTANNEVETCTLDDESFDCTICLAPVEDGEKVGILPCSHIFHAECLGHWIQRRNVCPLCQATEIASPRAIEEIEDNDDADGDDAVENRANASAPRIIDTDVSNMSSSPPAPNRTRRSQRLQLQSQSQHRRRRNEQFFIYSP